MSESRDALDVGLELALQQEITRRFRIRPKAPEYQQLRESPAFSLAARGDAGGREAIFREAKNLVLAARRRRGAESRLARRTQREKDGVTRAELLRSEVVSRELARLARRFGGYAMEEVPGLTEPIPSHVQRFRDQFCGGRPLTEDEARGFLVSPALVFGSASKLEAERFNAASDEARIVDHKIEWNEEYRVPYERATISIRSGDREYSSEMAWPKEGDWPRMLVGQWGALENLGVRPYSVADSLNSVSELLTKQFGWQAVDTTWFILTDKVPPLPAVIYELQKSWHPHHAQFRLKLTVSPWLSAESLAELYRRIQRDVLGYAQNRPTTEEHLELFEFVAERLERPDPDSWTDIARAWNKTRPKEERYSDANLKNIQRDFDRIRRQIMHMASARVGTKKA